MTSKKNKKMKTTSKKIKNKKQLKFFSSITRITTLKIWKMTSKKMKKNGRRPKKKEEEKRKTTLTKWKTNQSTKFNLIGCDTIGN